MEKEFNWDEFRAEAAEQLGKGKGLTGKDGVFTPLIQNLIQTAMEGELDAHLQESRQQSPNRRNGKTGKQLKSSSGTFEVYTPRDREGTFEPQLVKKPQLGF